MSKDMIKKPQKKMGLGRGLNSLLGSPDMERPDFEEKNKSALKSELLAKQILPPIERPSEKHTEKNTEKHTDKFTSKPSDNYNDRPFEKQTDKSIEKLADDSTGQISDKTIDKQSDRLIEKRTDQTSYPFTQSQTEIANAEDLTKNQQNLAPTAATTPEELRIWNVRIDKIKGNKEQPRKVFADEPLLSLSLSIKEQGLLQPITVRKRENGEFEIIAGERRWRAAQLAGLQEIPVIIKNIDDATSLELALIENIQRENLNPIEEAEAYFYLIKKYKLTQQELADKIGKDRATVANVLRVLNLAPDVRKMVANNELSMGQAKAIMSITDPQKQKSLAIKARDLQLSVRAVEKMVAKYKESSSKKISVSDVLKDKAIVELKSELQRMLGTKINIDYNLGKGKISISFYGDEELDQIVDKLREAWKH